jgi:hypothetical protein
MHSPKRGLRVCSTVVVSWTLLVGCEESGPTAPSDPGIGIHVYTDANFQGSTAQFTSDKSDLEDEESGSDECGRGSYGDDSYNSWDDCLSSIQVMPGWSATLYEHPDFKGRSLELLADAPNLQLMRGPCSRDDDWNDCTSSIRVRKR